MSLSLSIYIVYCVCVGLWCVWHQCHVLLQCVHYITMFACSAPAWSSLKPAELPYNMGSHGRWVYNVDWGERQMHGWMYLQGVCWWGVALFPYIQVWLNSLGANFSVRYLGFYDVGTHAAWDVYDQMVQCPRFWDSWFDGPYHLDLFVACSCVWLWVLGCTGPLLEYTYLVHIILGHVCCFGSGVWM